MQFETVPAQFLKSTLIPPILYQKEWVKTVGHPNSWALPHVEWYGHDVHCGHVSQVRPLVGSIGKGMVGSIGQGMQIRKSSQAIF